MVKVEEKKLREIVLVMGSEISVLEMGMDFGGYIWCL